MSKQWKMRRRGAAWAGMGLIACSSTTWGQASQAVPPAAGLAGPGMVASATAGGAPAWEDSLEEASAQAARPAPLRLGLEPGSRSWAHGIAPRWSSSQRLRNDDIPAVSIVTLPAEQIPGSAPRRAHHALSVRSETSREALRSIGLDVTECATRFRMPTRLRQNSPGGESTLDAQAQVSWACRF